MRIGVLFGHGKNGLTEQGKARAYVTIEAFEKGTVQEIYIGAITGHVLKNYLSKNVPREKIHVFPRGLTTAAEIETLSKVIPTDVEIVSISSWYHIPRIKRIWRAYGRTSSSIKSNKAVGLYDLAREIPLLLMSLFFPSAFSKKTK